MQQYHFELLTKTVSEIANIPSVTAADCKNLSNLIFRKTQKSLSETTLKRVFGLVQSKHNPSQFTVDTLSKYCGYVNMNEFIMSCDGEPHTGEFTTWNKIGADANHITGFTIKALKNRSGIPYKYTISRKCVSSHLDAFFASDAVVTALVAPSGFGKTTALLHWVEERLELNAVKKSNDIFLFFSARVLMSVMQSGQNIHFWLLSLLGCSNTEYFEILHNAGGKRFYLIVDGFDETTYKSDQFQLVLNQLIDIVGIYRESKCLKLLLTMLPNTWINNRGKWNFIRKRWFEGFVTDQENASNVPLLNAKEVLAIGHLINPKAELKINVDIADALSNPAYFETYYRLNNQNFFWKKVDRLLRYKLTSNLILEKISFGKNGIENTQLLHRLIGLMDLKNENNSVDQLKASALISQYEQVYQALESLYFLRTINKSTALQPNIHIVFCSKDILDYFITQWLLAIYGSRFSEALISHINNQLNDNLRLNVVKWLIWHFVNTGEKSELHNIIHIKLPLNLKADLLTFLGDILEHEHVTLTADGTGMRKASIEDSLLDYSLGVEFIGSCYLKTLKTLLRFKMSDDGRFLLHCYKAIMAIVSLDLVLLKQEIEELKELPYAIGLSYPVNPVHCITAVFSFLKYGIVDKTVLKEITRFSFNPAFFASEKRGEAANNMMGILIVGTLSIAQNPRKSRRVINILNRLYEPSEGSSITYPFVLKMFYADTCFAVDDQKGLLKAEEEVSKMVTGKQAITPYMEILVHVLKIKTAIAQKNHEAVTQEFRLIMLLANNHDFRLIKLYTISLLLKKYVQMEEPEFIHFCREVNYEHTKIIADSQVIEFWEKQLL